jgi:hypothetical protein
VVKLSTFCGYIGFYRQKWLFLPLLVLSAELPLFRKYNEALQEVIYTDEENQAKARVFFDYVHQKANENREKRERKRKQKASTPATT